MQFNPTDQQRHIVSTVNTGVDTVIQSGAGTGKTTTLSQVADALAARGMPAIYTALNNDVVSDIGQTFHRGNVTSCTFHSLALELAARHTGIAPLLHKLSRPTSVQPYHMGRHIDAQPFEYTPREDRPIKKKTDGRRSRNAIAADAMGLIRGWAQSSDPTPQVHHGTAPRDMPETVYRQQYGPLLVQVALHIWHGNICHPQGAFPFTHDHYLKLVSLAAPSITHALGLPSGSSFFYDEAQDARPSMLSLLAAQADMQLVAVGDSAQSIYGFTGAVDALPHLASKDNTATTELSVSFRFGQRIADLANEPLTLLGEPLRITGNASMPESAVYQYDPDTAVPITEAVIVRNNRRLVEEALLEMYRGRTVHLALDAGPTREVICDVLRLQSGHPAVSADLDGITTMEELADALDLGSDSEALAMAQMALRTDPRQLLSAIDASVSEADADVTITTIHKCKGRQWHTVRLAVTESDIVPGRTFFNKKLLIPGTGELHNESRENLRLWYVAVTRARRWLFVPEETMSAMRQVGPHIRYGREKAAAGGSAWDQIAAAGTGF